MRECSQAGINLIKSFEGCKLTAYPDQNGVWTIGWGHTGPEVVEGLTWTQEEADAQFETDLRQRGIIPVNNLVGAASMMLSDNQFSALISLCFNIGSGRFKASSALHLIVGGDIADVPDHILLWDEAGGKVDDGLVRRRQAEVALWHQPDEVSV